MAATVLRSKQAVEMSVFVVRAFVELREILSRNKDLARALVELERKVARRDKEKILFRSSRSCASWLWRRPYHGAVSGSLPI